jgi:hypothetical protein
MLVIFYSGIRVLSCGRQRHRRIDGAADIGAQVISPDSRCAGPGMVINELQLIVRRQEGTTEDAVVWRCTGPDKAAVGLGPE